MPLRTRRLAKSNAGKPTEGVLRGIENVVAESPARKRGSLKANKGCPLATPTPPEEACEEALKLGVSPIEACSALQSTRKRPRNTAPAQVITSTPNSTPLRPVPPVADLVEQSSGEPVSLGGNSDSSLSPFDIAMASPVTSHTSATPRRRRGYDPSQSPQLTVKKVKRTYSRGARVLSRSVNLFEEPELSSMTELEERFDKMETEHQAKQRKMKATTLESKAHKQQKQKNAAFEEWADKMAAEFEEIEKFELCVEEGPS